MQMMLCSEATELQVTKALAKRLEGQVLIRKHGVSLTLDVRSIVHDARP